MRDHCQFWEAHVYCFLDSLSSHCCRAQHSSYMVCVGCKLSDLPTPRRNAQHAPCLFLPGTCIFELQKLRLRQGFSVLATENLGPGIRSMPRKRPRVETACAGQEGSTLKAFLLFGLRFRSSMALRVKDYWFRAQKVLFLGERVWDVGLFVFSGVLPQNVLKSRSFQGPHRAL